MNSLYEYMGAKVYIILKKTLSYGHNHLCGTHFLTCAKNFLRFAGHYIMNTEALSFLFLNTKTQRNNVFS